MTKDFAKTLLTKFLCQVQLSSIKRTDRVGVGKVMVGGGTDFTEVIGILRIPT